MPIYEAVVSKRDYRCPQYDTQVTVAFLARSRVRSPRSSFPDPPVHPQKNNQTERGCHIHRRQGWFNRSEEFGGKHQHIVGVANAGGGEHKM
jgi:hypothetical protein